MHPPSAWLICFVYWWDNCLPMQHSTRIITALVLIVALIVAISCDQPITYPEGGYDYPKNFTAQDTAFYFYPLKDSFSRKDSFSMAAEFFYFQYLNEKNLSIKSLGKDIFRFTYSSGRGPSYLIILTEKEIVVKKPDPLYFEYVYSNNKLQKTEEYLLRQLELRDPLYTGKYKKGTHIAKHTDSLIKLYPRLADVNYYWELVNKKLAPTKGLKFSDTIIPISYQDFEHIVSTINASGYWNMPYNIKCDSPVTNAYGFSLEANTAKKYNYVEFYSCTDNIPMQLAFEKACQELVRYAKLDKQIQLVSDWKISTTPIDSMK